MADIVAGINDKITGTFSNIHWGTLIGWFIFIILLVGAGFWIFMYWKNKKLFNKEIFVNEIVNGEFVETYVDTAKSVKIGKGGFEILYLKKLKTWKIAYGGRTGRNRYDFYIMPDGYWYCGRKSANLYELDKKGGFIPIVITNPMMRGQYTSLEKQIDTLMQEKKNFWEQYGGWIMAIGFVVIAGTFLFLNYKQFSSAMSSMSGLTDKLGELVDKVVTMTGNVQTSTAGGSGLVAV